MQKMGYPSKNRFAFAYVCHHWHAVANGGTRPKGSKLVEKMMKPQTVFSWRTLLSITSGKVSAASQNLFTHVIIYKLTIRLFT